MNYAIHFISTALIIILLVAGCHTPRPVEPKVDVDSYLQRAGNPNPNVAHFLLWYIEEARIKELAK